MRVKIAEAHQGLYQTCLVTDGINDQCIIWRRKQRPCCLFRSCEENDARCPLLDWHQCNTSELTRITRKLSRQGRDQCCWSSPAGAPLHSPASRLKGCNVKLVNVQHSNVVCTQ